MRPLQYLPQLAVLLLAYTVREYKIEKGNFVIWDEAHFGKFSQSYLNRTFYFDVHPPYGKMLTALSGYIFGQSDAFKFTSRDSFPEHFDYVGMRRVHALISSSVPLFAYLILRRLGTSVRRSMLCALLFIFDNGMSSIGRLILLDSHLLAFTAATAYALACLVANARRRRARAPRRTTNGCTCPALDRRNVAVLGALLGCVVSIKWIGCLVMLLVGLYIVYDLYTKLLCCRLARLLHDFAWYSVLLIALPLAMYVAFFYAHFRIVDGSGEDDGFMSTGFQLNLRGSPFGRTRKYISFGKQVTIRCPRGYLHSHMHVYPGKGASDEQAGDDEALRQVTAYSAKDSNNNFYFQNVTDTKDIGFLRGADSVVLFHAETRGYLEPAGAEAYFSSGLRMANRRGAPRRGSVWTVEVRGDAVRAEERVKAITTEFYLRSVEHGCYLSASERSYPGWGYNQGEVFCARERGDATAWQVEENFWADTEGNPLYSGLRKSFVASLVEHNALMYRTNKGFRQNDDLEPEKIVSSPAEWPLLRRGLRMSQWGEKRKFYMFMNPLLLYVSTAAVLAAPLVYLCRLVRHRRRVVAAGALGGTAKCARGDARCASRRACLHGHPPGGRLGRQTRALGLEGFFVFLALAGWAVHYLAFFCVGRVLYLHHYFPAYFFALLCLCYVLRFVHVRCLAAFAGCCVLVYLCYSPLTYGFVDAGEVRHLKLLPSWDFVE